MPTLQDGWALHADGLQIHRWFLHVQPFRRQRVEARYGLWHERVAGPDTPSLGDLLGRFSLGALEHLLCPLRPAQQTVPPAVLATAGRTVSLAGRRLVAVDVRRTVPCGRSVLAEPEAVLRDEPAVGEEFADRVTGLLAPDVAFLVQLAVDVLVLTDGPAWLPPARPGGGPISTVVLPVAASPPLFAEHLLVAAASEVTRLFIETRGMYLDPRPTPPAEPAGRWRSPRTGRVVDARALAMEVVSESARHRFLTRLVDSVDADLPEPDLRDAVDRLAASSRYLAEASDFVYPLAEGLDSDVAYDLVCTFFPGPRRFEKYQAGAGAGQSQ